MKGGCTWQGLGTDIYTRHLAPVLDEIHSTDNNHQPYYHPFQQEQRLLACMAGGPRETHIQGPKATHVIELWNQVQANFKSGELCPQL